MFRVRERWAAKVLFRSRVWIKGFGKCLRCGTRMCIFRERKSDDSRTMTLTHHTETRRPLACIILAAGKGTRMKSDQPKVLHKVAGRSMVAHVVAAASMLAPEKVVVVVGPGMDSVAAEVAPHVTVVQENQRGTGDAVMAAQPLLEGFDGDVLVAMATPRW